LRNNRERGESSSGRKLRHELNISRDRISQIVENAGIRFVSSLRRVHRDASAFEMTPRNDPPVVIDHDRWIASHVTAAYNRCVYAGCALRRLAATAAIRRFCFSAETGRNRENGFLPGRVPDYRLLTWADIKSATPTSSPELLPLPMRGWLPPPPPPPPPPPRENVRLAG
jgi:hypothetical protein